MSLVLTPVAADRIAFPQLTPTDLQLLRPFGTPCSFEDGETIFHAGGNEVEMFVVESGAMDAGPSCPTSRWSAFMSP